MQLQIIKMFLATTNKTRGDFRTRTRPLPECAARQFANCARVAAHDARSTTLRILRFLEQWGAPERKSIFILCTIPLLYQISWLQM